MFMKMNNVESILNDEKEVNIGNISLSIGAIKTLKEIVMGKQIRYAGNEAEPYLLELEHKDIIRGYSKGPVECFLGAIKGSFDRVIYTIYNESAKTLVKEAEGKYEA